MTPQWTPAARTQLFVRIPQGKPPAGLNFSKILATTTVPISLPPTVADLKHPLKERLETAISRIQEQQFSSPIFKDPEVIGFLAHYLHPDLLAAAYDTLGIDVVGQAFHLAVQCRKTWGTNIEINGNGIFFSNSLVDRLLWATPEQRARFCAQLDWANLGRRGKSSVLWHCFWRHDWAEELAQIYLNPEREPYEQTPNRTLFISLQSSDLARQLVLTRDGQPSYYELIETFPEQALPWLLEATQNCFHKDDRTNLSAALGLYPSPDAAQWLANNLGKAEVRIQATPYFLRFPDLALQALSAVTDKRAARFASELVERIQRMTLEESPQLEATADQLPPILRNPPRKLLKMPKFWDVRQLPPLMLKTGARVPLAALENLGQALARLTLTEPPAGLEALQAACTPDSLSELSWELARIWESAGSLERGRWMFRSLRWLADAATLEHLGPNRDPSRPALTDLEVTQVLFHHGSDAALRVLVRLIGRRTAQNSYSVATLEKKLGELAKLRGLCLDALEEQLLPEFGLDQAGFRSVNYGGIPLKIGFNEYFEPVILEGTTLLPSLPRVGGEVEAEKQAWSRLKADVQVWMERRVAGLERALLKKRIWERAEFERLFLGHPLMRKLARKLLWEDASGAFRVAEDDSFWEQDELAHTLGPQIWLAHPAELKNLADWQRVFEDYRILSPFPQLSRPILLPQPASPSRLRIPVPPDTPDAPHFLTEHGWQRVEKLQGEKLIYSLGPDLKLSISMGETTHWAQAEAVLLQCQHEMLLESVPPRFFSEMLVKLEAIN